MFHWNTALVYHHPEITTTRVMHPIPVVTLLSSILCVNVSRSKTFVHLYDVSIDNLSVVDYLFIWRLNVRASLLLSYVQNGDRKKGHYHICVPYSDSLTADQPVHPLSLIRIYMVMLFNETFYTIIADGRVLIRLRGCLGSYRTVLSADVLEPFIVRPTGQTLRRWRVLHIDYRYTCDRYR